MPWFYCPAFGVGLADLPADELHHAGTSLRLQAGDAVVLFDGVGQLGYGRIAEVSRGAATVVVEHVESRDDRPAIQLTLAVAMPKGHRQAMLLEKCTELNVSAFWPLSTERSVVRPAGGQLGRWRRATIEAAKQCHRAYLPHVSEVTTLARALEHAAAFKRTVIADPGEHTTPIASVVRDLSAGGTLLALIGPEGGWTDDETARARAAGARVVSLGPLVLRVETAAMAIAAALCLTDASH